MENKGLFGDLPQMESLPAKSAQPAPADQSAVRVVGLAVASNLWRHFDYSWPAEFGAPSLGQRVYVPFGKGNRKTLAFVTQPVPTADTKPAPSAGFAGRLKQVAELIDQESQFDGHLWQLGKWISQYYLTPLGMTLAAMVPSAVGKHADKLETVAYLAKERHDWPASLGLRQKNVLDELYEARKQGVEPLALEQVFRHSGGNRDTVRRLVQRELIRLESRPVNVPELTAGQQADAFDLSVEQAAAMEKIRPRLGGGFSVTLLLGVTGSGKTEVYIRAIRQVVQAGLQAILLAPEIALATQTLQRLINRLPRVAVLHSGLTSAQRAFYYQQIRDGKASVVVGPRSAIFAPTRNLGLIVVDEEHEPSYKQDSAPRYHARDVAVMRANLSGVPVILGSATPSLESLHNAQLGRYELVRLQARVRGLPMPKLQIVHLRQEMEIGRVELLGKTLTARMAGVLDRGEQIILLMNRRGYASYVFCPSCGWILTCDHCSRAMVFHQATRLAMCHYCQASASLNDHCPACKKKLLLFGYGIQRIEGELARKFPQARIARMDSDTMTTPRQFQRVFDEFGSGRIDILLGTQMVAKGLDFPKVSLVGVVSADTSLVIPDFRSAERTFQLIVQVAGRAGRSDLPGTVIVQTLHADEPAIVFASSHDYDGFSASELALRKEILYPPFARMLRFVVRHEQIEKAQQGAQQLADAMRKIFGLGESVGIGQASVPSTTLKMSEQIRLIGPQPCGVLKVKNQFRFHILLLTTKAGLVQQMLWPRMEELARTNPAEIITDVDPMQVM
jgi:primosomal protein N' (replication factor Y)